MKRCVRCGETKERTEFYRQSSQKDGLCPHCKPCRERPPSEWVERQPAHDRYAGRDLKGRSRYYAPCGHLTYRPSTKQCWACRYPVQTVEKACSRCSVVRPLAEFHERSGARDGRTSFCRTCDAVRGQKYPLTSAEHAALVLAQGGVCAICERPERIAKGGNPRALSVDHCHTTGVVRALLCRTCNLGIGMFEDTPEFLRSAINYLEKHERAEKKVG